MKDRQQRQEFFRGVIALAAMAMGGNLPYRRLCRDYGAELTCSEMIVAHKLVKGGERPLLRFHPGENRFGVQLVGKRPEVMADAAVVAAESGARFIDLNFGCPIDVIVRRGMGAALLKRPAKLAEVVAAVRTAVDLPLSVKIRSGWSMEKINAVDIARRAAEAGADAVGVHGRTRAQRYTKSADWAVIADVSEAVDVPVLGNGDILTHWDMETHKRESGISSFLVARGALTKPWIFQELKEGRVLSMSAADRWAVLRRFVEYATEHFGDDDLGLRRVKKFFLWHLRFWHRYRNYTEEDYLAAQPSSLLQQREPRVTGDPELELLASSDSADHEIIWSRI